MAIGETQKKGLNKNLHSAKKGKNDEFYTQLEDIERELKHYKEHFKDKVVYCNCDDPRVSVSIAQYINGDFAYMMRYFHNLHEDEKE